MHNVMKQVFLYIAIAALILLFQTLPDSYVTWIDGHWNIVGAISFLAWIGYCACDNHKN